MREIERRLRRWRNSVARLFRGREESLDEFEDHLRESVQALISSGMTIEDAFRISEDKLGQPSELAIELSRVELPNQSWLPIRLVWLVAIGLSAMFIKSMSPKLAVGGTGTLMAIHMISITLGYLATISLGMIGICFLVSRLFSGLNTGQLRSLNRNAAVIALMAFVLTALGMVMGVFCPNPKQGPFWGWSAHEVGGVAILGWDLLMLICALKMRSRVGSLPLLMVGALFGNVLVLLGWLAAMSFEGQAHSVTPGVIVSLTLVQLPVACSRFVPAGSLCNLIRRLN